MSRRLGRPRTPSASANRAISATCVSAYLVCAMVCVRDPARRATLHAAVVISLGYGHLVGAWLAPGLRRSAPARRLRTARTRRPGRRAALLGGLQATIPAVATVLAFAAFTGWLAAQPLIVLALLGLAAWHTAENDLSLEGAYANAGALGPLARSLDDQLAALGASFVLLAVAGSTLSIDPGAASGAGPDIARLAWLVRGLALLTGAALVLRERSPRSEGIGLALIGASVLLHASIAERLGVVFADVFALTTGYHLVSWIVLTLHRGAFGHPGAARALVASHVAPIGAGVLLLALDAPGLAAVRTAFFAPAAYLYWSALHVVHTAWRRERRRPA